MPKKSSKTELWERQEGESAKAYEAFSLYLEMGVDRSIRAVSNALGKSGTLIDRWCSTWNWVERCRAYDNVLAQAAKEAAEKSLIKMRERQIKLALRMQEKAAEALDHLKASKLDANEIVKLIVEGTKLEAGNRNEDAGVVPQINIKHSNGNETISSLILKSLLEDNSMSENGSQQ